MKDFFDKINIFFAKKMVNGKKRGQIYHELAMLLRHRVRLDDAVRELARREEKISKSNPSALFLRHVSARLRSGKSLGAALVGWAPPSEVVLIAAGEGSELLGPLLEHARTLSRNMREMRSTVSKAIIGPLFMIASGLGTLALISVKLQPVVQQLTGKIRLPTATHLMVYIAHIVRSPALPVAIFVMILAGAAIMASMPRWANHGRRFADKIPPWSLYRLLQGAGWLYGTASMLQARVPIAKALSDQRKTASPWLDARLGRILFHLNSGKNIGVAMERARDGFPDPWLVSTLTVLARLPDLDHVMLELAEEWLVEGIEKVKVQAKMLNTFAMLAMGLAVLLIVMGVLGIMSAVRSQAGSM